MATVTIKHATLTGAAANPAVLVDGPKWDATHTVTGLENVDNTSDANKPVSTATQTALDAKAGITGATVANNVAIFSNTTGSVQDSSILSVQTNSLKLFVGIGDNIPDFTSRWGGGPVPLVVSDRLVTSATINTHTYSDWTTLAPVASTSNQYCSWSCNLTLTTAFNYNHAAAFEDLVKVNGTGTVAEQWSFLSNVTYAAGSTVTNRRAVNVADALGTGTIGTQYGSYVASLTRASTNWAYYADGVTPSFFGGNITIGIASPAASTVRILTLNGATSGAGAGSYISGNVGSWVVGNASAPLGSAYDATLLLGSSNNQYRLLGFTAGPLVSSANGTLSVVTALGYISGLTLSTAGSSATFGIAAGVAVDSTGVSFMTLGSAYTKTTSAWAVGTGNGSLDTGAIATSTSYHVYQIERLDTGVVDFVTSLSASAPTLPTNYTIYRRIGSMRTNGSSQWVKFSQLGDEFLLDVPVLDLGATIGTSASLQALSVPTGVKVSALIDYNGFKAATTVSFLVTSPDQADTAPSTSGPFSSFALNGAVGYNSGAIRTNTSAQIRLRSDTASTNFNVMTRGWIDRRGRDG